MFHYTLPILLLMVFSNSCASENMMTPECEKRETYLATLDFAKESISKAKDIQGSDVYNATTSQCEREKHLGYLNVALNLITDAKKTFESNIRTKSLPRHEKPMDCSDVLENGHNTSGDYIIWPRSRILFNKPHKVYCDMETDGGGWTVIQRRGNFSKPEDFYLDWQQYKTGFGNVSRDFWIGNDNIFSLSNQGMYQVRFDLQDVEGSKAFAIYDTFWIEDEKSNYKLHIKNYIGDAGDAMAEHNLQLFSTKDRKNDRATDQPCSTVRHGAWWYFNCAKANLNGLYQPGKKGDHKSVYWYYWKDLDGLATTEIKIRRK